MKRKFISALLFGALIAASTSTFVSCAKDYDGDITELRTKVTTNATDLSSLVEEKVKNVQTEIDALKAQQSALETAYAAADEALAEAIANATNDAEGYADIQAAEAQRAAIAAAQEMVDTAVAKLEESLETAKQNLSDLGQTVDGLLEADKTLNTAIAAAQSRADAAYTLAEQAKSLAEAAQSTADENKANIEKLTTSLKETSDGLAEVKTSLADLTAKLTTLEGDVKDVLAKANTNATNIAALTTQLNDLKSSNEKALKSLSDKDDELNKLINENQTKIEAALANETKLRAEADANLQKAIDAVNLVCQGLKGDIETINSSINAIKKSVSDLESKLTSDINSLKSDLTKSLDDQKKALEEAIGKKADSSTVEALEKRVKALEDAIKTLTNTDDFSKLQQSVKTNTSKIEEFEKAIIGINNKLSALIQSLNNLVTGIIVQDYTDLEMLCAKVKNSQSDINQTSVTGLTMYDKGTVYFPYKGATDAQTLTGNKYNVEKNIGLIYVTLNPNTIDFNDKARLALENSKSDAPCNGNINVGKTKTAADKLITTRAAAKNGLYQARLSFTGGQQSTKPTFENSYALYTTYNSIDSVGGKENEHRVYSKYEINLEATDAASDVTPVITPVGATTVNSDVARFSNDNLSGKLTLGTQGDKKVYAKYVEVVGVKTPSNAELATTSNEYKAAKASIDASNTGMLNKVLFEPEDDETNNFNEITVKVDEAYNGYTFKLRYYIQQYDGVVKKAEKEVMFTKPMFASETVNITNEVMIPTASGDNTVEIKGDGLTKLAYMTGSGNYYTKWKDCTKYLTVEGGDAPIKSVTFGYSASSSVEVTKGNVTDISSTILSGGKKVTKVIVNYDPKDFELGEEYSFNIGSYDTNGNEVTTTKVTVKMGRPTFADTKLTPNPAFAPDGTLTVWAKYEDSSASGTYVISNAFNAPISETGKWALRLDLDNAASYAAGKAYASFMPTSGTSLVATSGSALTMKVPAAALQVTELDENGNIVPVPANKGTEHTYTIHYGPQYFGLTNLWYWKYTGPGFENDGASIEEHKFNIVFKSPVYYAAKEAHFKFEYEVDFPKGSTTIPDEDIVAKNPSASKDDAFSFLATSGYDIEKAEVVLKDTKYSGLFKEYKVDGNNIEIETIETGTVNTTTVKFALRVTDKFGNVADIPFKVKVKGNN